MSGIPKSLNIDWYEAIQQVTLNEFVKFLKEKKIQCKRIISELDDVSEFGRDETALWIDQPVEQTGAGIEFRFYTNTGEIDEIILNSDSLLGKKQRLVDL